MITIHLHNLKFYSFHGVHEEEKLLGNEYEVNADVQFHEEHAEIHSLSQTINYAEVYEIINKRMHIPASLLETVVMDIGNAIHEKYDYVRYINISLKKLHPPIEGIEGAVGVSWHKEF
ncbi:MAG: dihydroneopterin aldolase [Chitinophagaceae bacterium]|nr:dihydroneopterin aldolase [Chitinophagaceae bacterium]MDB5223339.1 dihydroneopterin aldolase [Chitinophagaceae bacterium]